MDYRILGPLEVWAAGRRLDIDAPKQRAILAVLLLHANEVVATDRLLDLVWGDEPPSGGVRTLRFHISKLRDALQPERAQSDESAIATRPPGYVLAVDPDELDVRRFEQMAGEARSLLATDPSRAIEMLDNALGLWRGPPLSDFTYEEFARLEIVRLEELRLRAVEDRFDAALALGLHRDLIGELRSATEEHPLRERLWGQLMTALFRAGRRADALRAYRSLRSRLGEERGLEPSSDLAALEERILVQDATLLEPGPMPAVARLRGYVLREKLGEGAAGVVWRATQPGLGREVAIKAIRPELANRAEFVRRFETEARLVAELEHPHVVSLFDFWRDPDGAYLVMPYLQGGSLGRAVRQGRIDATAGLRVIATVGSALAYAHRRGVVHRDISPQNVLLDEDGNAYLGDLGVAVLVGEEGMPPTPSPAYTSPEQLEGGTAVPASDVYGLGMLTFTVLTGTDPLVSEPLPSVAEFDAELSAALDDVLAKATAARPEERFPDVESYLAALAAAVGHGGAGASPPAEVRNPYKGLRAFEETDALDFFGRDPLASELVDAVARHRLVAVVGPSGCGKSSLVRAGLIPSLRRGALSGSGRWLITDLYPGDRPFDELEAALMAVAVQRPASLADRLRSGDEPPAGLFAALLPDHADLLLIVDQFEELFTLTPDDTVRRRFMELLTALVDEPGSRVRIVVTLRADFYDRPLQYARFGELVRRGLVSMTMPSEECLVQAVNGPADIVGLEVEPGLASEIVHDVADQPGGLPLLEYALTELFHRRSDGQLTFDAYQRSGGVLGALGRRAEDLLAGFDDEGRAAIRQVFLRLVAVDEGISDARRRIPLSELHGLGIDPSILERALGDYGSHRLLTFDRDPDTRAPTVEVAHEALLARWDRLRGWTDDRRDQLVLQRRLATAVAEWAANGRRPEYLLTGGRLEHYQTFAADTDLALTDDERGFLAASRRNEDELTARRRRRRRTVLAGFAAAAVVALVLATLAVVNQQRALDQAELVRLRELAASAIGVIDDDPELSLMLALEAAGGDEPIFESITALHEALLAHRVLLRVDADLGALSPTGESLAVRPSDSDVIAYDASTGELLWIRHLPFPYVVFDLYYTHDGDHVVAAVFEQPDAWDENGVAEVELPDNPTLVIFDAETGEMDAPTPDLACGIDQLIPDGHGWIHVDRPLLARAPVFVDGECDEGTVAVVAIDLDTGTVTEVERFNAAGVTAGQWSTDDAGRLLALSIENRTTVIDLASGQRTVYGAESFYGSSHALSTDGSLLLTMGMGIRGTVWNTTTDTAVATFPFGLRQGPAWFSGEDTHIVAGDGVWDIVTSDRVVSFSGSRAGPATMSADGRRALTGAELWQLGVHGEVGAVDLPPFGYQSRNLTIAAGTGAVLQSGIGVSGPVLVFDLESGKVTHELPGATGNATAVSPDGRLLAVQEEPSPNWIGTVRVHDLETGGITHMQGVCSWDNDAGPTAECAKFPQQPFPMFIKTLEFSPDGTRLVGAGEVEGEAGVVVWNTGTGEVLRTVEGFAHASLMADGERLVLAQGEFVAVGDLGGGPMTEHDVEGWVMRFSADGSRLAVGPSVIAVYDTATWTEVRVIETESEFRDLTISPNGAKVATAGRDGFVRVYDTSTGALLQAIPIGGEVTNVEFVNDDHLLAVPRSGPGYIVTTDVDELLELARQRIMREFTPEECATYRLESCQEQEEEQGDEV